jgi:hypothetical protein
MMMTKDSLSLTLTSTLLAWAGFIVGEIRKRSEEGKERGKKGSWF